MKYKAELNGETRPFILLIFHLIQKVLIEPAKLNELTSLHLKIEKYFGTNWSDIVYPLFKFFIQK